MTETIASVLICIAAVPATLFPIFYSRSPWTKTPIGRALMLKAVGIMLLVDTAVIEIVPFIDLPEWLGLAIFALVTVGIWYQFLALLRTRHQARQELLQREVA